jgi:hypothetical protein
MNRMPKSATLELNPALLEAAKFDQEPQWFADLRQAAWDQAPDLTLPDFAKINYRHWPLLDFAASGTANETVPAEIAAQQDEYNFVSVGKRR